MAGAPKGRTPAWSSRPLPLVAVRITAGFWAERQETNRLRSIPHILEQCAITGRIDALRLQWKPGQTPVPHIFWDSDVAKWLEAASSSLATHPDPELLRRVDEVVALLERAQRPDGYLNSHFIQVEPEKRWTNLRDQHELYCAGHLIEAAVAHFEATGSRRFLDVMRRYADHIGSVFGAEPGRKRGYPGHEEIELALVKLARATGEERYLRLAEYFVLERGRQPHYYDEESRARGEEPRPLAHGSRLAYEYNQAHLPVTEQRTAEGHAVRAMYLYSAMADLAAETGNPALLDACRALWRNVTERRMYVTGGVGSSAQGERFTTDFDLPNESAYAETCAAIGLVFWAERMLSIEGDGRYGDVLEQALYNGVLAGLSADGCGFFYVNRLAVHPSAHPGRDWGRKSWFSCACCPPNVARLIASLGGYLYGASDRAVALHQYASSQASFRIGGVPVRISQQTDYPWDGRVSVALEPEREARFAVRLRVPSWCADPSLAVNGTRVDLAGVTRRGYAVLDRLWRPGDSVTLRLPMPVRRLRSRPAVRGNGGRVALARGPLLYCLEQADNGAELDALSLPSSARFVQKRARWIPGGGVVLEAAARRDEDWKGPLYRAEPARSSACRIRAVPYYAWCNRTLGEMLVWVREAER